MMKPVDIIIPVYNGYEYLIGCAESVLKHTDLQINKLIIIDDKSPDIKTRNYVKTLGEKNKKILTIFNKENAGFVANVNKGMHLSNNDVILLNSDTVVTHKWVEKLQNCAFSNQKIATVTPLSNNAYLTSIPNMGCENKLPENYTIDSMAELVEQITLRQYPALPTGNGFCIYIKRSAINKVGYFDEAAFGKGYGEEVDFCLRAINKGYINVCADDTYIYHQGSASFSSETRIRKVQEATKIINQRYPDFDKKQREFVQYDSLSKLHTNLRIALGIFNQGLNTLNILFIKHHEATIGGIGVNTLQIMNNLNNSYYSFILEPENNNTSCSEYTLTQYSNGTVKNKWYFKETDVNDLIRIITSTLRISIIHVQYLIAQLDMEKLAALSIPMVLTIHENAVLTSGDPFLVNTKSTDDDGRFHKSPTDYLESQSDKDRKIILERFGKIIKYFDKVVVPSDFMRTEYSSIFRKAGINATNLITIEHGHPLIKTVTRTTSNISRRLNLAFIGHAVEHKGLFYLFKLAKDKRLTNKIRIHLLGNVNPIAYKLAYKRQSLIPFLKVHKVGGFNHSNLTQKLIDNNIDIGLILSPCSETYSYTLSDCIQHSIPVIGHNIGAVGERINKHKYGWVFDDYEELIKIILNIYNNRILLDETARIAQKHVIRSVGEMTEDYEKLYCKVNKNYRREQYPADPKMNSYMISCHESVYRQSGLSLAKAFVKNSFITRPAYAIYLEINHLIKDSH